MPKKYTYGHGGEAGAISFTDQMHEAKEIIGATKWDNLSDKEKKSLTKYLIMKGDIEGEGEDYSYADGGMMAKGGATERFVQFGEWKLMPDKRYYRKFFFDYEDAKSGKYREIADLGVVESMSEDNNGNIIIILSVSEAGKDYFKKNAKMADGGMMAKGGKTKKKELDIDTIKQGDKVLAINGEEYYVCDPFYDNSFFWVTKDKKERYNETAQGNTLDKYDVVEILESDKYADGGMMAEKYVVKKDKDGTYLILNTEKNMYVDHVFETKESADGWKKEKDYQRKTFGRESYFNNGGMMAKGGKPKVIYTQFEEEEFEYADGGETDSPEISIYKEDDERSYTGRSTIKVYYVNGNIGFDGRLKEYHSGIGWQMEFEPDNFDDKESEDYYDENWERIEEEIVDEFYKNGTKKMADGGQTDGEMMYKMAEEMTDSEYDTKFSELSAKQKMRVESLIRLGDTPKLALATILLSKENDGNSDTYTLHRYSHGGKTYTGRHRKQTLEEKALEAVGPDTWFQLDRETQAGVIAEMVSMGALPQRMAKGAAVAEQFVVEYELIDGKKVTEKYDSEELMDEGIANFYINNDVKDAVVNPKAQAAVVEEVVVKDKTKKKSIFDVEKAVQKVAKSSKQPNPVAHIVGIEREIKKYDELKAIIKNAEAEKELIRGVILEVAKDYYLDIYEQKGERPTTITLESGGYEINYSVTDKYKTVTPEKETVLRQYDGLLGIDYTFTFDNEILDTEGTNGEKIGDIINDLIENSTDIPEDLKSKVVKMEKKVGVKKGTIKRLLSYDNPSEIFEIIEPTKTLT